MTFTSCPLPPNSNDLNCSICLDGFNKEKAPWAHQGEGLKHPCHYECIKTWLNEKPRCPFCSIKAELAAPSQWKEKAISCLKFAGECLAGSAALSGCAYLVTREGVPFVVEIATSRWIWAAAGTAALCLQEDIAPGRFHRLRNLLTVTSMFVAINAGAALGAARSASCGLAECSSIGALAGFGATIFARNEYSMLKVAVTSLAITGLVSSLYARAGFKESLTGTLAGATTGGASVVLSALAIPVTFAAVRFVYSHPRS